MFVNIGLLYTSIEQWHSIHFLAFSVKPCCIGVYYLYALRCFPQRQRQVSKTAIVVFEL